MMEFLIETAADPNRISFLVTGVYKFRVGVRRSGSTATITSADLSLRKDGVNMVPVAGVSAQSPPPTSIAAFLLDRGRYTTIEAPEPGVELAPIGINNRGQIAGYTAVDLVQTELHGFLLAEGVEGDFTPIDFPGAALTAAFDINDRGQIIGAYANPDAAPDDQPGSMHMPMMMSGGDG
jgi:uncharacterized membrane protein